MNKKRLGDIMFPLFNRYSNPDYISTELKSLHEGHEITDDEYDQCLEYWDEILLDWESKIKQRGSNPSFFLPFGGYVQNFVRI